MDGIKERLLTEASEVGFIDCRVCRPDAVPEVPDRLQAFVASGYHGQMTWMEERMHWRGNPAALWPEARSVILLAESYTPSHDPLAVLEKPELGAISVYAQGRDYHDTIKKALKALARWLVGEAQKRGLDEPALKVFVDTAPVMEKPLGATAGIGWQGKHSNLVSREHGSWLFLGAIYTTIAFES